MKKIHHIITIALLILAIALLILVIVFPENKEVTKKYSFTKAICENGQCQDYEFVCDSGKLVSQSPLTGFVSHSNDWEDPRTQEDIARLCE